MRKLGAEEIRERQLRILDVTMDFCRTHEIRCYLAYGTLLGAARHQGYIPWDDDIDLIMLREEYEKLCNTFNENRTDTIRLFCLKQDPNFPFEFAKVGDTATWLIEGVTNPYPKVGVNIDVFVADDVVEDENILKKANKKVQRLRWIQAIKSSVVTNSMKLWKRPIFYAAKLFLFPYPFRKSVEEIEQLSRHFQNVGPGQVVAIVPPFHSRYYPMPKAWFQEEVLLPFEGREYPAPQKYHELLTIWYGDYMKLPPEEQRVTHHNYSAYQLDNGYTV